MTHRKAHADGSAVILNDNRIAVEGDCVGEMFDQSVMWSNV